MSKPPRNTNRHSYYSHGRDFDRLWHIVDSLTEPKTITQICELYGESNDASLYAKRIWICSRLNAWYHLGKIARPAKATYANFNICPPKPIEVPDAQDRGPGEGDGNPQLPREPDHNP